MPAIQKGLGHAPARVNNRGDLSNGSKLPAPGISKMPYVTNQGKVHTSVVELFPKSSYADRVTKEIARKVKSKFEKNKVQLNTTQFDQLESKFKKEINEYVVIIEKI